MGIAVRLVTPALRVVPGEEAGTDVRVRNAGHVVDQVDLTVLGETAAWARVEPPQCNLLPGQEETVRVTFAPPRTHDVTAGQKPYAVRAASREDADGSVAEEGVLTVGEFDLVVADIVPRASRAPRAGRHQLAVDNLSNHPLTLRLTPSDPDAVLDFRLDATQFVAEPGTATFVKLRARPTTRFLRGAERQLPFEVAVSSGGAPQVVVPGTVRQHSILPAWLFRLVLIVALLIALWVGLLKPRLDAKVRTLAGAEAARATAPLAPRVSELAKQAEEEDAAAAAATATPSPSATPTATATPSPTKKPKAKSTTKPTEKPGPVLVPADPVKAKPLATRPVNFYKSDWVPPEKTLPLGPTMPSRSETVVRVTKVVIQVPYGDIGSVTVEGIDENRAARIVQFDGQRRLEVVPRGQAVFDSDNRLVARGECRQVNNGEGGDNPGVPPGQGLPAGSSACFFVVMFLGYTQDPSAPRPVQEQPTPEPPPQELSAELPAAAWSRRPDF